MMSVNPTADTVKHRPKRNKRNKLYRLWGYMKDRCCNPSNKNFHNYGGRGIHIFDEWLNDYDSFADWANANGYRHGLDIDRIDNDGHYSPDNCRFVTRKVNCNNTRRNVKVMFRGVAHTIDQLTRKDECVVNAAVLCRRLSCGWEVELAMTRPLPDRSMLAKIKELKKDPNCTVSHNTILYRVRELGWTLERAALTPSMMPWLKR